MKILLIEDEVKVSRFIKKGLEEHAYSVDTACNGETGISMIESGTYDLVILDILLPQQNGFEVCETIRKNSHQMPIIMLTALSTLHDAVKGLDSGADDYLTKPFHFKELLARIRALNRRNRFTQALPEQKIQVNDLYIDLEGKTVHRGGENIQLTAREFRLLVLLAQNKGRVLSRTLIAEQIWEQSFESGSNVIDVYINFLRKKIDKNHGKKLIHTMIGMGYVLRD